MLANVLYQRDLPGQLAGSIGPGVPIDGHFDPNVFAAFLLVSGVGLALGAASLAILNGTGWLWARFAELMLGVDESRVQLADAQAEAKTQEMRAERAAQRRRPPLVTPSPAPHPPVAPPTAPPH